MNNEELQATPWGEVSNQLRSIGASEWELILAQATVLHKSGFLPKEIKSPEAAVAIIVTGRELDIPMMAALRGIDIIQGTPAISPALMLALAFRSKALQDFQVETSTETECTVRVQRKGFPMRRETFTIQDAQKIMTSDWQGGQRTTIPLTQKYNWKSMPKVMLRWRAISAALRIDFSDIFFGLYTPDELGGDMHVEEEIGATVAHPEPSLGVAGQVASHTPAPRALEAAPIPSGQVIETTAREVAPISGARADAAAFAPGPPLVRAQEGPPAAPAPAQAVPSAPDDVSQPDAPGARETTDAAPQMTSAYDVASSVLDAAQNEAEGHTESRTPLYEDGDAEIITRLKADILELCGKMGIRDIKSSMERWIARNYKIEGVPVEGGLDGLMESYANSSEFIKELTRIKDTFQLQYEEKVRQTVEQSIASAK